MIIKVNASDIQKEIFLNTDHIMWVVDMHEYLDVIMSDGTGLSVDCSKDIMDFCANINQEEIHEVS
jgi:hypothetical protein